MGEVEKRSKQKDEINKKIMEWYEKRNYVPHEMRYLFKIPLIDRCMRSMKSKEAWIKTVNLEIERNGWSEV